MGTPANTFDVLEIVKLRFDIKDDLNDALIGSYVVEIGRRIMHYCNISEIPSGLTSVWASMVMDALRVEQPNLAAVADNAADNMRTKIGDTDVQPAAKNGDLSALGKSVIDRIVLNYKADLIHYRRLRW